MEFNKMMEGILETYRCLISWRKNMPGMRLEECISQNGLRLIEAEYEWLKQAFSDRNLG